MQIKYSRLPAGPSKGDFDANDLVVGYRAIETLNAKNEVTDLKLVYEIVARGFRMFRGEIDIVARDGAALVFVEVKSNRGRRYGAPEEMVTPAKQRRLARLAAW